MKKTKFKSILGFFILMLIVPFITIATLSRYEPFGVNNRGLLIATLIVAVVATLFYAFTYRDTNTTFINIKNPKNLYVAILKCFGFSLICLFLIVSTFMRFDIVKTSDQNMLINVTLLSIIITVGYYLYIRKSFKKSQLETK